MSTLPAGFAKLIPPFDCLFSRRVFESAQLLLAGAILAPGKRTVTSVLHVMGLSQERHFQTCHRVLNRAAWSSLAASRSVRGAPVPSRPLPAVNKQKEIGIKTRAWANVFAQAALFQIDRPQTTVDAGNRFILGGKSRYRGLELSASGDITAQWGIVTSMQLLDAKIVSVGAANAGELGKTPENTPRRTASAFVEHRLSQVAGLSLNAGLYHVGKRAVNNLNQAWVGSYTTLSLGARYRTKLAGRNVTLQANLDNAMDRDYWSTAGNGLLGTGAPRTLRLAAKFDL